LPEARQEITWNNSTLSHFDHRTNQCELEVQRIIQLQNIANKLPDAFTDNKKIIKSHIAAANAPANIEVPVGQSIDTTSNESKACLKRRRPIGANDNISCKRKSQGNEISALEEALPTKQATKIHQSKLPAQNSPVKKSPKDESPEELPLKEE